MLRASGAALVPAQLRLHHGEIAVDDLVASAGVAEQRLDHGRARNGKDGADSTQHGATGDGGTERDDAGRNITLLRAIEDSIREDERNAKPKPPEGPPDGIDEILEVEHQPPPLDPGQSGRSQPGNV